MEIIHYGVLGLIMLGIVVVFALSFKPQQIQSVNHKTHWIEWVMRAFLVIFFSFCVFLWSEVPKYLNQQVTYSIVHQDLDEPLSYDNHQYGGFEPGTKVLLRTGGQVWPATVQHVGEEFMLFTNGTHCWKAEILVYDYLEYVKIIRIAVVSCTLFETIQDMEEYQDSLGYIVIEDEIMG